MKTYIAICLVIQAVYMLGVGIRCAAASIDSMVNSNNSIEYRTMAAIVNLRNTVAGYTLIAGSVALEIVAIFLFLG